MKTQMLSQSNPAFEASNEAELVVAAKRNDETAIRGIIRAHNKMLFRLARSILSSDDEAEDAVQAAYTRAFTQLDGFRAEARLSTWLGRIVLNEARGRMRRQRPTVSLNVLDAMPPGAQIIQWPFSAPSSDPERKIMQTQTRQILEHAIGDLPPAFRTVLVARMVEEMSIEETAALLGLRPETVKTRLHRAKARLRAALERQFGAALTEIFPFGGERCQRMADRVVAALRQF